MVVCLQCWWIKWCDRGGGWRLFALQHHHDPPTHSHQEYLKQHVLSRLEKRKKGGGS